LAPKKNLRLPKALNLGFSYAVGDYLTWTSDDNEYLPEAIEIMKSYLDKGKDIDLVYSDFWIHDHVTGKHDLIKLMDDLTLKEYNALGCCFLYTHRVYETIGNYNPKYELVEDYEYWIRITKQFKTIHCPKPLYIKGYHKTSLTAEKFDSVILIHHVLQFQNGFIGIKEISEHMRRNIIGVIGKRNGLEGAVFSIFENLKRLTSISIGMAMIYGLNSLATVLLKTTRIFIRKVGVILPFK
jgi:glycosyltransferase involved in cell wall biosynthesis